jgi:hypothetical protein
MAWLRALAAGVLISGAASAQTPSNPPAQLSAEPAACDATSTTARQFTFDGEVPFAGASIREAMTGYCTSILLYRLTPNVPHRNLTRAQRLDPPSDDRPHIGAPVFYARIHGKQGYPEIDFPLLWADQRTCPALLPAVAALERALIPKLTGDGPVRNNQLYSTIDGASVTVWAAGMVYPLNNTSHHFDTTYRTNLGAPTADWVEATLKALRPCLSSVVPKADPPIP